MKKLIAIAALAAALAACGSSENPGGVKTGTIGEGNESADIRTFDYKGKSLDCISDQQYHGLGLTCDWVAYHMDEIAAKVAEKLKEDR